MPFIESVKPVCHNMGALCCAILLLFIGCNRSDVSQIESDKNNQTAGDPVASNPTNAGSTKKKGNHAQEASRVHFTDVTSVTGIQHRIADGSELGLCSMVEMLGGGCALVDFDRDGELDLFFSGGGTFPTHETIIGADAGLFRGLGDFRFEPCIQSSRIDTRSHFVHGTIAGDYDHDGFIDLLLPAFGHIYLFKNNGDGTFQDVSHTANLGRDRWNCSAAWGDIDNDGDLDVYVVRYVDWRFDNQVDCRNPKGVKDLCGPLKFDALRDSLYLNQGDGSFIDATEKYQLAEGGPGLGVLIADFDQDSDVDIYVANDERANFIYRNDENDSLTEIGIRTGAALSVDGKPDGSMGVCLGDFDGDSQFDLFVTHYETETSALYRNTNRLNYTHSSRLTNITSIGNLFVGWGNGLMDLELDGDEDILFVNGHALRHSAMAPLQQLPVLLDNQSGKFFEHRTNGIGEFFETPRNSRGLAFGDFDQNGLIDAVATVINEVPVVLRNSSEPQGDWLQAELIGTHSNRSAIGARMRVETPDGKSWTRTVVGGGSYLSTSQASLHFGFGRFDIDSVSVKVCWPNGEIQNLDGVTLNQRLIIVQPKTQNVQ